MPLGSSKGNSDIISADFSKTLAFFEKFLKNFLRSFFVLSFLFFEDGFHILPQMFQFVNRFLKIFLSFLIRFILLQFGSFRFRKEPGKGSGVPALSA